MGIPYAKPPVGSLRFFPPQPAQKWDGVLNTTEFRSACPQQKHNIDKMSEDCLYLNIWSPAADGKKRPVMFFIHGGSFAGGSGSEDLYAGASLSNKGDVVLVTINYRVGVLGFLDFSFLGENFYANCGLRDVAHALKWVYENIAAFGGDAENITVFGQSAGGTISATLPTMPSTQPFISKCIVMSGGPTHLQKKEEGQTLAKKYMKFMGIDSPEELYRISAEDIALQQNDFTNYCGLGAGTFRITVDNDFVPEFPIPAVGEGAAKGIPLLIGTTNEELSFLFVKPVSKALDIMSLIRKMTNHEDEEIKKMMFETYEKFYKGRKVKTMMFTDFMFRIGSVWYAEEFSKHSDVWMYRFDFETTAMRVSRLHSFHSSDLPFVFGNFRSDMAKLMLLFTPFKKKPRLVADEIQRDFIEFARTGKLQWSNCQNNDTPAKCYNMNTFIEPIVKPDIKEQYKGTHLRKICFQKSMIGRR